MRTLLVLLVVGLALASAAPTASALCVKLHVPNEVRVYWDPLHDPTRIEIESDDPHAHVGPGSC